MVATGFSVWCLIFGSPYEYSRTRNVNRYVDLARTRAAASDYSVAIQHLRSAIALDPGNSEVIELLDRYDMYARLQRGRIDEELEDRLRQRVESTSNDLEAQNLLALLLHVSGRPLEALELAEKTIRVVDAMESPSPVDLGFQLGATDLAVECLAATGQIERADTYLEKLEDLALRDGTPSSRGRANLQEGRVDLLRGDLQGATDALNQALGDFRAGRDSDGIVDSLFYLSTTENLRGETDSALTHLQEASVLAERSDRQRVRTHILQARGEILGALGRLDEAHTALTEALWSAGPSDDPRLVANILVALGALQAEQRQYAPSAGSLSQAVQLFRDQHMIPSLAIALVQYAIPVAHLRSPRAEDSIAEARALYGTFDANPVELGVLELHNAIVVRELKGDARQALKLLKEHLRKTEHSPLRAEYAFEIGSTLENLGRREEAIEAFKSCLQEQATALRAAQATEALGRLTAGGGDPTK